VARYRHYVNSKEPGVTLFVTTTVLDFVHAFRRDEPRTAMARQIARECPLMRPRLNEAAFCSYSDAPRSQDKPLDNPLK